MKALESILSERWRPQFSLRMLMLSMTCCAVALAATMQLAKRRQPDGIFEPAFEAEASLSIDRGEWRKQGGMWSMLSDPLQLDHHDAIELLQSREMLAKVVAGSSTLKNACIAEGAEDIPQWLQERLTIVVGPYPNRVVKLRIRHPQPEFAAFAAACIGYEVDRYQSDLGSLVTPVLHALNSELGRLAEAGFPPGEADDYPLARFVGDQRAKVREAADVAYLRYFLRARMAAIDAAIARQEDDSESQPSGVQIELAQLARQRVGLVAQLATMDERIEIDTLLPNEQAGAKQRVARLLLGAIEKFYGYGNSSLSCVGASNVAERTYPSNTFRLVVAAIVGLLLPFGISLAWNRLTRRRLEQAGIRARAAAAREQGAQSLRRLLEKTKPNDDPIHKTSTSTEQERHA